MSARYVALTFDAEHPDRPGFSPDAQARIVDVLASEHVRATFFMQGRWVGAFPEVARRIVEDGHEIGSHSHHHVPVSLLNADALRIDLERAEAAIRDVAGADPKPWFRCPFGIGAKDPTITSRLESLGYRHVHWDVNPLDWRDGRTSAAVADSVVKGVRAHDSTPVVVMHTWAAPAPDALPIFIERLRGDGVEFVTVAEWWDEIERDV